MADKTKNHTSKSRDREFCDTKQIALISGMSEAFFEKARVTGKPPIPYIKFGRAVRYHVAAVLRFFAERTQRSTSDDEADSADQGGDVPAPAPATTPRRKRGRPRKAPTSGPATPSDA